MSARPSRIIIAIARWALLTGVAGVVMGSLAIVDVWREPENVDGRRTLLFVAAVLLSISFVLAPLVRRAFARPTDFAWRGRAARKTLLDEMRQGGGSQADSVGEDSAVLTPEDSRAALITKLLIGAYGLFAATLVGVLWALRLGLT